MIASCVARMSEAEYGSVLAGAEYGIQISRISLRFIRATLLFLRDGIFWALENVGEDDA